MKTLCRLLFALTIVLGNLSIPHPALAFDAAGYFSSSYSVNLSKTQVLASEVFQVSVTAQVNCLRDLPFQVSEGYFTDRLVAVHAQSGNRVVLVPSYTLSIKPFPKKNGESTQQTRSLDAAFPKAALPGRYDLVSELIEARAKVLIWVTVTSYLPQSKNVGSITVVTTSPSPPAPTMSASPTSTSLPIQTNPTASTATADIGSSAPPSQPQPSPKSGLNWLLVGGIGGVGAGALLLLWMGLRLHRRFHRL